MANSTIRVTPEIRDAIDRVKFQLAGKLLRNFSQGDTLIILCKLAENHMDECIKIAEAI
jgi:hypothetical protein